MEELTAKVNQFAENITTIATPVGILSLTVIFFALIASPLARRWAEENKGLLGSVIGGLLFITLAGPIVTALFG